MMCILNDAVKSTWRKNIRSTTLPLSKNTGEKLSLVWRDLCLLCT